MSGRQRLRRFTARAWRFSAVGAGNALVDLGALNLLLWLFPTDGSLRIAAYNGVALLLANVNSYLWNTLWTFREKAKGDARQRVLFAGQALVNVAINAGLFWLALQAMLEYAFFSGLLSANLAKLLSTVFAFAASFFILRHLVFSQKRWRRRPAEEEAAKDEVRTEREVH